MRNQFKNLRERILEELEKKETEIINEYRIPHNILIREYESIIARAESDIQCREGVLASYREASARMKGGSVLDIVKANTEYRSRISCLSLPVRQPTQLNFPTLCLTGDTIIASVKAIGLEFVHRNQRQGFKLSQFTYFQRFRELLPMLTMSVHTVTVTAPALPGGPPRVESATTTTTSTKMKEIQEMLHVNPSCTQSSPGDLSTCSELSVSVGGAGGGPPVMPNNAPRPGVPPTQSSVVSKNYIVRDFHQ